jgi:formate-dependent nitrite reductase membrane component NrfD
MDSRTVVDAHARLPWWRNRHVLVPLYFSCGGLSGGALAVGALAELMHAPGGDRVAPLAYRLAFPLIAFGSFLLLLDLTRPLRFFRLLTHFNPRSPVSLGSYGLVVYGGLALLFALAPLAGVASLPRPLVVVALAAALFIASYTGVLLTASSKPAWNASPLMGGIFLALALASGAAALILLVLASPASGGDSIGWLRRFLAACLGVQALLLAFHLWRVQRVPIAERAGCDRLLLHGRVAAAFWIALALLFATPLVLPLALASASVLLGGLLFRYAIFLAEE